MITKIITATYTYAFCSVAVLRAIFGVWILIFLLNVMRETGFQHQFPDKTSRKRLGTWGGGLFSYFTSPVVCDGRWKEWLLKRCNRCFFFFFKDIFFYFTNIIMTSLSLSIYIYFVPSGLWRTEMWRGGFPSGYELLGQIFILGSHQENKTTTSGGHLHVSCIKDEGDGAIISRTTLYLYGQLCPSRRAVGNLSGLLQ